MKPPLNNTRPKARAFTLVELLVVIGIIGAMLMIATSGRSSFGKPKDFLADGVQQLLDDLEWARIHAMSRGGDVSLVFFPNWSQVGGTAAQIAHFQSAGPANDLLGGQRASYAIFAEGGAGEQPGQPMIEQVFLTKWRRLPEGVAIPVAAFNTSIFPPLYDARLPRMANDDLALPPFDALLNLPAIRFHGKGGLTHSSLTNLVLPLEHYGTNLLYPTRVSPASYPLVDVLVSPAVPSPRQAQIEVSVLTGRPKLLFIQP